MNKQPTITIAICTYNRADYLRDTLGDLSSQTADSDDIEILVINNNSTDNTADICSAFAEQHPNLNFSAVTETNQGLSHARNRAIDEATANYLLYIDDDVVLKEDFAQNALDLIREYPHIRCTGGRIFVRFDGLSNQPDWIPNELMPMFGLHDLGKKSRPYRPDNFPRGGNMLIHKEVFDKAGRFDTDLGRIGPEMTGSEEKALFDRARKAGFKLWYTPQITLTHRIGPNRLDQNHLKNQSVGIGKSEYLRLKHSRVKLTGKFLSEIVKYGGSLLLSVGYLARGRIKAARFLLRFRNWVLKGFLSGSKNHLAD